MTYHPMTITKRRNGGNACCKNWILNFGSYGMHYQLNARCHLIREDRFAPVQLIELALADTSLCECHKIVSGFNGKMWINRRRAARVQTLQWALRCNSPYSFSTYINMFVEASQRIRLKQKSITCFRSLPPQYLTRRTNFDIIVTSRSAKWWQRLCKWPYYLQYV